MMGMATWPSNNESPLEWYAKQFAKSNPPKRRYSYADATSSLRQAVIYIEALCDEIARDRVLREREGGTR